MARCGDGWTRKYDQHITLQVLQVSEGARSILTIESHHKDTPDDVLYEEFRTEALLEGIGWNLEPGYAYDMKLSIVTPGGAVNPRIWFGDRLDYDKTCRRGTEPPTCRFTVSVWSRS